MQVVYFAIILGFLLAASYLFYYSYVLGKNKQKITWIKSPVKKSLSIIIASYNEEDTITKKISNLMELDYDKNLMEFVFIDSGSTDKTPEIITNFIANNKDLKTVFIKENERKGKSHALNIAYPRASGEIKIISDSDAILKKDAISQIVQNFSDPKIGAACGKQILLNIGQSDVTQLEKKYRDFYEILREGESKIDSNPIFHGELSAYRSELIDVLPENKSADDSRLANLIRFKGFRSVYDSKAQFYEYAPTKWASRITQKVRRAQGLIRLFWDLRSGLFRRDLDGYGRIILPFEFCMHCIFPSLWILTLGVFFVGLFLFNIYLFALSLVLLAAVLLATKVKSGNSIISGINSGANLFLTFFSSQVILFYALLLWLSGRSLHKWKKVDDVRKEFKQNPAGS
jgi:poly-beta-1,6-N-acetyl-D-glucosamine synthase